MPTKFHNTRLKDVWELRSSTFKDHRGAFTNLFRYHEHSFMSVWQDRQIAQVNLSVTEDIGVIRGLHMQDAPYAESKIVRCLSGRAWDVAVDLRPTSKTIGQWHAVELAPEIGNALLIPEGCAHGFQALEKNTQLLYLHSGAWSPEFETGVRWNDPTLRIPWPLSASGISSRDSDLPLFEVKK